MADGFHEIELPIAPSYGTEFGTRYDTRVVELDSGLDSRSLRWSRDLRVGTLYFDNLEESDFEALLHFYHCRMGKSNGWRFKYHLDYIADIEPVVDDGGTIYLAKDFGEVTRIINKPIAGTTRIFNSSDVEQFGFTVDPETGIVTGLTFAPGMTHYSEYCIPVRFDSELRCTHSGEFLTSVSCEVKELAFR